jgi:uncharacterized protein YjbJ (UPF0337 family)
VMEIKSRWSSATDREKWAARGASFAAKAKATKAVWFPPEPVETGKKATKRATRQATGAAKRTTGAAKRTTGAAKRTTGAAQKTTSAAKKTTGATKKTPSGTKKRVTSPVRRKRT